MLRELSIANLALVDKLRIEFLQGLNTLTGETGAGKSIIIDAVGLALGGRFSSEMIRVDAESAQVEAVFELDHPAEFGIPFEELGVPLGEDGLVILSREVAQTGRNRCRINGQTVTVQILGKVGSILMDIHGQNEHQSLLSPEKQLAILDAFGGPELLHISTEFVGIYERWAKLRQDLTRLDENIEDRARRMELIGFQLEEIREAKLVPGEDDELLREREILGSAERLYAASAEGYLRLYGEEDGASVLDQLGMVSRALDSAASIDPKLTPVAEMIREATCQAEEAAREIRNYRDSIAFDPERLEQVERRLDELAKLKKKYGESVTEILAYREQIEAELNEVENRDLRRQELQAELEAARTQLADLAEYLSKLRKSTAEKLEQEIRVQLADLNMAKTIFKVEFSRQPDMNGLTMNDGTWAVNSHGIDKIEFLVAPNIGEGLKPLAKIASGGELSRLMLAVKAILAEVDRIPTMVFDEIDTGIGGRTAQAVAEKLMFIAQSRQVICVTHLPQIASLAHNHLFIQKTSDGVRTRVDVRPLEMGQRVEELARMLGGAEVTETTRQHAREMLTLAESLRLKRVGSRI
jgi:DNA repair protein RecN (Recombination protein N)